MTDHIIRKKKGDNFEYYTINNKKITNKKILDKIKKIYIAPAYSNVEIFLNGNILATGINKAGRKQYIYSDKMKKKRELKKYKKLIKLTLHIDKLKNKINNDLMLKKINKNKLIALVLKIMDLCNFRSGNKTYEKKYGSFGITTIHKKHISIKKNSVEIDFVGKKGVTNHCFIKNPNIQKIIKNIYKLSTKNNPYLFSIKNKNNNETINISMTDINKYLEKFKITSKDLRTWNANIIFLKNLKEEINNLNDKSYNEKIKKKIIKEAIKNTAISLHHTPAICKSSYIFKNLLLEILNNDNLLNDLENKNDVESILKKYLLLGKKNYI